MHVNAPQYRGKQKMKNALKIENVQILSPAPCILSICIKKVLVCFKHDLFRVQSFGLLISNEE